MAVIESVKTVIRKSKHGSASERVGHRLRARLAESVQKVACESKG
jgi:hypothetical protein